MSINMYVKNIKVIHHRIQQYVKKKWNFLFYFIFYSKDSVFEIYLFHFDETKKMEIAQQVKDIVENRSVDEVINIFLFSIEFDFLILGSKITQESQSDLQIRSFSIGFHRNPTEPHEIRVGSGRIWGVFRRIPTKSGSESDWKESDKKSVGSDRNYFKPTGSDHPSVTWVVESIPTAIAETTTKADADLIKAKIQQAGGSACIVIK